MPDIPEPLVWAAFILVIVILVAADLGLAHRKHTPPSPAQAAGWSLFWILLSVAFGLGVLVVRGEDDAEAFFTGYLLEKSLSVDNLFVFLLIFQRMRVPDGEQRRVLTWGILGALALRAVMIFAGIGILHAWHPVVYVFGAFLIYTAVRTIEASDVLFAVDSVPAILAITDDPFIVFSSNILAILGLRALFFVVVRLIERLRYLRYGLAAILALVGAKMLLADVVHVPPLVALALTVAVLAVTIVASLVAGPRRVPSTPS